MPLNCSNNLKNMISIISLDLQRPVLHNMTIFIEIHTYTMISVFYEAECSSAMNTSCPITQRHVSPVCKRNLKLTS